MVHVWTAYVAVTGLPSVPVLLAKGGSSNGELVSNEVACRDGICCDGKGGGAGTADGAGPCCLTGGSCGNCSGAG